MNAAQTEIGTKSRHHRDDVRSIVAAILPVTISGTPITVQPGMVQGMVDYMHISDVHAGYIAAAEVGGLMVATVLFAFVSARLRWRLTYAVGLAIMIVANVLSALVSTGAAFILLSVAAGFGAGMVTAIGFASLGETSDPPRNYGWAVASIIGYSAIALWALPTLFEFGGFRALLLAYAVVTALCLPLVPLLAHNRAAEGSMNVFGKDDVPLGSTRGMLAVLSVLTFFVGYAAAWTYMALLGRDAGISDRSVSYILSISQFCGVAGALSIAFLSGRASDLTQTVWILTAGAVGILAFATKQHYSVFFGLNCLFQFAWNAGQPLLLGIIASRDKSGKLLRFAIPLQYIGLAIGPGFAAYLLGAASDFLSVMAGSAVFAALTLVFVLPILLKKTRAAVQPL